MNLNFNDFCFYKCDGLYDPRFKEDEQCTGYILLKKMVVEGISPASLEEIERWETNPTPAEKLSAPHIKYLRFLHELLRPFIIQNWHIISKLKT